MNASAKFLQDKTEPELADYQTSQVGNTCSFHVIAAGIRLLLDHVIDPAELSDEINRLWWRGRFMRVLPDWAVTPRMQVRIVRHLARTRGLPISAAYQRGNPETLSNILTDPTAIPIITLIWRWRKAPPIFLGSTKQNYNATLSAGGHSMLLAAYDPHHTAQDEFTTPWGFINTWKDGSPHLFWMADADFRSAWRFWLPGVGRNALVIIKQTHHDL